eukprot:gene13582-biopygen546
MIERTRRGEEKRKEENGRGEQRGKRRGEKRRATKRREEFEILVGSPPGFYHQGNGNVIVGLALKPFPGVAGIPSAR